MNKNSHRSFLGSGWSFPVTFSAGNLQVKLTKDEVNINETIDIILNTKFGERLMDSEFGSGLQQYMFRSIDETLRSEMIETIKTSLLINEPRITVENVVVEFNETVLGRVDIMIEYIYNQVNTRYNYVFPFYLNEGTNLTKR